MPTPSLADVQRWMRSAIRANGGAPAEALARVLNPQRQAAGAERLAVYAGGYVSRTEEALATIYEAVRYVLGARVFHEMAHGYVQRYPSRDYNLNRFGRHLPEFLAAASVTASLPFLPDLAELEWRLSCAFHAQESAPMEAAALAGWPVERWSRARLRFQPSMGLVASAWPIRDIWEARTQPRHTLDLNLTGCPHHLLVYRQGVAVACEALEPLHHRLLEELLRGRTLGEACEALAQAAAGQALPIQSWCAHAVSHGLIAGYAVPTPD